MRKKARPQAEPTGDTPYDFTDLKVVRAVLGEAFASHKWPSCRDHLPEHPTRKHPKDKKNPDGTFKKGAMEMYGKFNLETCMTILGLLAMGSYHKPACETCGVTSKTGLEWVRRGLEKTEPMGTPYWVYARALRQISASVEGRCLQTMHTVWQRNSDDPAISREVSSFLRMRFPQRWSERSKVDVTSNGKTVGEASPRLLLGINRVIVDAATATPEGHSFILEGGAQAEKSKTDEEAALDDFLNEL